MLLLTTVMTVTAGQTRGTLTFHRVGLLLHKTGKIPVADIFVFEYRNRHDMQQKIPCRAC